MLILSGMQIGRIAAGKLWDRADALHELAHMAELLRGEMAARQSLPAVCRRYEGLPGADGMFFRLLAEEIDRPGKDLEEYWQSSLNGAFGQVLSSREMYAFQMLAGALRTGESFDALAQRCAAGMEEAAAAAREKARQDSRMWTGLGLAAGAALAVLLI